MENKKTLSGLITTNFETQVDGKNTQLYILTNEQGMEVTILNYGAKIVSLVANDKNGMPVDVVTGHNSIEEYLHSEEPYFGAVCGRYANRIAKGRFELDGVVYDKLPINNGPNSLHGGIKGFNSVVWDVLQPDKHLVILTYTSPDGEEGYPGNLQVSVFYYLTYDNELMIYYTASVDKPTVLNLTNHSYFNLSGAGDPYIGDHLLSINADYYLPTDATAIPYGPKAQVEGTPMDFRTPHEVGEHIHEAFEQLVFGKGYDHTYILNREGKEYQDFSVCARCVSPKTGIAMEILTTEPGVQFYTGNWMTGNFVGKNGQRYPSRSALCLETQHFPNSPNQPDYPSVVLRPGEEFHSRTIFRFSIEE
ncbi:MAG: galactose mutarotase [Tannerellaceae bacterium]|jgi:aldose 1-epimerase|nr:galactose mutarotase [Tannerellaceae bacterium]